MSQAVLTLDLPDEILERLRRTARGMKQPLEEALVNIVKAATPSLDKVPSEYRVELEAMEDLSDEDLWQVANSGLAPARERRLATLLHKIQREVLTDREARGLTELRVEADRLMLHRSYAYLLLKYRGQPIPNLAELRQ
jgi:hypothetical protein